MHTAYLLTGSNLGERANYLLEANTYIVQRCGKILSQSSIYETAPWGLLDQPVFLNQAIKIETSLKPVELMKTLLAIETKMGRIRTVQFGPRIIDLDILLIDQDIIKNDLLIVPHPALAERRFALMPLDEIAPLLWHPVYKKTIHELLILCKDKTDVQKKINEA